MRVAVLKFAVIVKISQANGAVQFDRCIVIPGLGLNVTATKNFQTEKDKGSRRPISEIKTDSVGGKIELLFAVL